MSYVTTPYVPDNNVNGLNDYNKPNPSGIPTAIYKVVKHPKEERYGLEPVLSKWHLPDKIYGDLRDKAVRVWNRFAKLYNRGGGSTGVIMTGHSGAGKALHKDTLVRVLNGWKPIKDIKIGDIVIGRDGRATKVTGVYPQGKVNLYKITFEDGRSTRPCENHLWSILNSNGTISTLNTKELIKSMDQNKSIPFYIPLCKPVLNTTYMTPHTPRDIGKRILNYTEERIPKCYLENTSDIRQELLEVILNNKINNTNEVIGSFKSSNLLLINDISYLARSLGLLATVQECNIDDTLQYNVVVQSSTNGLGIVSIEPIESDEAYCIAVANEDHLYVIEDFIVTHNTETARILCNIGLEHNMPVIEVSNLKCTIELVNFVAQLNNVIVFMDEFAKNFGALQETMLTALSDIYKTNKIYIITENETGMLNRFILNSPSRAHHHFVFKRIDKIVLEEYCKDNGVAESFLIDLLAKYDRSPIFSYNHLKAIVEEHLDYPEDTLDKLLSLLNVSILNTSSIYRVTKVFNSETKEEVDFTPNSINVEHFNDGGLIYLRFKDQASNYKCSKIDILTTLDDGNKVLLQVDKYVITLEISKDSGGESRW